MMYENTFSKILGTRRLKLSQVSKDTGVSMAILRNFYYDRRSRMRLDTMLIICEYLDIGLEDLIERTYEEDLVCETLNGVDYWVPASGFKTDEDHRNLEIFDLDEICAEGQYEDTY